MNARPAAPAALTASLVAVACLAASCRQSAPEEKRGDAPEEAGGGVRKEKRGDAAEPVDLESIYARGQRRFAAAHLFKPELTPAPEEFDIYLAPLILQEMGDAGAPSGDSFGAVVAAADGGLRVDPSRPTVYYSLSTARLAGRELRRLEFIWWYSVDAGGGDRLPVQGVRLTLDAAGFPLVMETLADTSGVRLIYTTRRLETAAAEAFGGALAGRRFAVEAAVSGEPRAIVPRLLKEAPSPMGPFLYLLAGSRNASTLLCRCEPSQVGRIPRTIEYELAPLASLGEATGVTLHWAPSLLVAGAADADDLELEAPDWLDRCLRLPDAL